MSRTLNSVGPPLICSVCLVSLQLLCMQLLLLHQSLGGLVKLRLFMLLLLNPFGFLPTIISLSSAYLKFSCGCNTFRTEAQKSLLQLMLYGYFWDIQSLQWAHVLQSFLPLGPASKGIVLGQLWSYAWTTLAYSFQCEKGESLLLDLRGWWVFSLYL